MVSSLSFLLSNHRSGLPIGAMREKEKVSRHPSDKKTY